jgi:hypothetical protein
MPGLVEEDQSNFDLISITEIHPTFGAEVSGVDFSKAIPKETFDQIRAASAKVRPTIRFNLQINAKALLSPFLTFN